MRKIAILIGNNDYVDPKWKLECAVNDAESLANTLNSLQFDTMVYKNVCNTEFSNAMTKFSRKLQDFEVGLFFFAGHGFQIDGDNYLASTDTSFADDVSMKHTAYQLKSVLDDMQDSPLQIKIIIIDACRTYARTRGGTTGFAPVSAPRGTIIAFATSPGQTSKEKDGHGIYTKALLQHITSKNIPIEEMFKRVRNSVYLESSGSQITWEHTSLMGKFSFNDYISYGTTHKYSRIALADADYEPVSNGKCYELIKDAKTRDFHFQNTIPGKMNRWIREMFNENPDDIFVLGRTLYMAAENAFKISNYFDSLQSILSGYDKSFANHLLAGMAFEIYFDSNGKLRKRLKTNKYYRTVLILLMNERYDKAREFLVAQLEEYPQQIVYIPGEQLQMRVELVAKPYKYTGETIYLVHQVFVDGINVIYNDDGDEPYNSEDDNRSNYEPNGIEKLSECFLCAVAGTKRNIEIEYVDVNGKEIASNVDVLIPGRYSLLRYSN